MKNYTDLTGKNAIVTGAAQGLSLGMAEGLMEAGAKVCIIDVNPKAEEVAKEKLGLVNPDEILLKPNQ